MSVEPAILFRSIEQLLHQGTVAGLDERALLERFASHRDGRALTVLIATHGPMVLGVCRRILHEPQDVEDAFQSTFMVLVRRAGSIRDPRPAGGLAARCCPPRRAASAGPGSKAQLPTASIGSRSLKIQRRGQEPQAERAELLSLIDEEMDRLPQRYRDVLVLCDLEGQTYTEAAQRLRCPLGTVQSRLARARQRLRGRLSRKGVEPVASAAWLTDHHAYHRAPSAAGGDAGSLRGGLERRISPGDRPRIARMVRHLDRNGLPKNRGGRDLDRRTGGLSGGLRVRQPFGPGSGTSSSRPRSKPRNPSPS